VIDNTANSMPSVVYMAKALSKTAKTNIGLNAMNYKHETHALSNTDLPISRFRCTT